MNVYKQRVLNVAKALRESPSPRRFTMRKYGGFCGTPCCALGHYAARKDLQGDFSLRFFSGDLQTNGHRIHFQSNSLLLHFDLSEIELHELFSSAGCGNAQTPLEAATYIEHFAERKWPEPVKSDPAVLKLKEQLFGQESQDEHV